MGHGATKPHRSKNLIVKRPAPCKHCSHRRLCVEHSTPRVKLKEDEARLLEFLAALSRHGQVQRVSRDVAAELLQLVLGLLVKSGYAGVDGGTHGEPFGTSADVQVVGFPLDWRVARSTGHTG